jgi:hypothetical protein
MERQQAGQRAGGAVQQIQVVVVVRCPAGHRKDRLQRSEGQRPPPVGARLNQKARSPERLASAAKAVASGWGAG